MLGRRTSVILSALALAGSLAACGGSSSSSGVTAGAYVKAICTAVGPFEKDVQARSSALNLSKISNPIQGKTALQGFLTAVTADTGRAVSQLKAAGSPDVTNGKQISAAIVSAFSQLQTAISQAANQANSLPTSSAAAFKTAAQALGTGIQSSIGGIGSSLSGLKSPALEKAAKSEPSCTTLGA
jgi:hypothetical protein